jgi:hypothetical protein
MPHLAGAKSQELVSRMLVSLAAGHKSNEGPAFKAIARRNQQSYELVELSIVVRGSSNHNEEVASIPVR